MWFRRHTKSGLDPKGGWIAALTMWLCLLGAGCRDGAAPGLDTSQTGNEDPGLVDYPLPEEVDPETEPLAGRAREVFDRLVTVYSEIPDPRLRISDVEPEPLAWAKPDNWIVVSAGALRSCYDSGDTELGDLRLAFIISHELAHLAGDHFSHLRIYRAIQSAPGSQAEKLEIAGALVQPKEDVEIEADEQGLVHLAWAGYQAARLARDFDFFDRWGQRSPAALAFSGVSPDSRTRLLMGVVKQVAFHLPYFELGTRFYQLGRYEGAVALLESFERQFSGPAVLNNLGLCHYQMAARRLAECDGQLVVRFKLPTLLSSSTIADRLVGRGPGSDCTRQPEFMRHKKAAERYFRKVQARAPDFLPAAINYLSLMLLAQEGAGTLARTFEIEEANLHYGETELLRVLGYYLYAPKLIDKTAVMERLRELRASRPDSAEVSYNLARVLLESGEFEAAKQEWRQFLELEPTGPYADYVRQQLGESAASTGRRFSPPPTPPRQLGPIDDSTRAWLAGISAPISLRSQNLELTVFENDDLRVVTQNDHLVLIEQELPDPVGWEALHRKHGDPSARIQATRGDFLVYRGFGFDLTRGASRRIVYFD